MSALPRWEIQGGTIMLNKLRYAFLLMLFSSLCFGIEGMAQRRAEVNSDQMQTLLNRIGSRTNTFRQNFTNSYDRSRDESSRQGENINRYIEDFSTSLEQLRQRSRNRNESASDVEELLSRGLIIDNYIKNN